MKDKKTTISEILESNREWYAKLDMLLKTYQELYIIPSINSSEKISPTFFNYCLKGRYFVVICLYNSKKEIFIQRDFTKRNGEWEFVGGWLKEDETFDQAVDRIVKKETGSILVEAVPISLVKNSYFAGEDQWAYHYGLAYLGRLRHDEVDTQNGVFSEKPETLLTGSDKKILELSELVLDSKVVKPPIEEVDSYTHLGFARYVHNLFIKPISYYGSSRILQQAIIDKVSMGVHKTVIDVACGDDEVVISLAKLANLVVANDISRQTMLSLIKKSKTENILFTNQNLLELSFKTKFDVVICKNSMHHMRNAKEVEMMLKTLRKLGKRIVLMDVEDPTLHLISKLWNSYYVRFLNDQGGSFISFNQFKSVIDIAFQDANKVVTEKVQTIKGTYMLAVVDYNK